MHHFDHWQGKGGGSWNWSGSTDKKFRNLGSGFRCYSTMYRRCYQCGETCHLLGSCLHRFRRVDLTVGTIDFESGAAFENHSGRTSPSTSSEQHGISSCSRSIARQYLGKYIHSGIYGEPVLHFRLWRPFGATNGVFVRSWKFAAEWWNDIRGMICFWSFLTFACECKRFFETKFMDVNVEPTCMFENVTCCMLHICK